MPMAQDTHGDAKELRLQMRLDVETSAMLDDLRRRASDLPGRSEMIRRLIHEAHGQVLDTLPSVSDMLGKPKTRKR
jgi:hypothetical protein